MPAPDEIVIPAEVWKHACQFDHYVSTAPLVVAEVFSPPNRRKRLDDKIRLYLENGVALVIEVDRKRKLVKCYSGNSEPWIAVEGEEISLPDAIVRHLRLVEESCFTNVIHISIRRSLCRLKYQHGLAPACGKSELTQVSSFGSSAINSVRWSFLGMAK